MTGNRILDWALMAVSLSDTILLLWLGLTVLLNTERRNWGVWMAGGGLLTGAAFFVSHSAIIGHGANYVSRSLDFWWRMGWPPVVAAPLAWYVIMLWYAGFWDGRGTELWRRQRPWFLLLAVLALGLIGLLAFVDPLPSFLQVPSLDLGAIPAVGGVPLLMLIYPAYIVMCISLSLDALRRPAPSLRMMGDLARRRARPWLMAASFVLLLVALLVAWIVLWIAWQARSTRTLGVYAGMVRTVAWFDLVIAALIGLAVVLLGQAIVSYEVFTGKTLPRRGLFRHWRSAVVLAAGYGAVVGAALAMDLKPINSLLLSAVLMTAFYALSGWRSFVERERYIDHLRPFVSSQRLYENLMSPAAVSGADATAPFRALCHDILETSVAYLVALGPLAPLVGPPVVYPERDGLGIDMGPLAGLLQRVDPDHRLCLSIAPEHFGGAVWAIPLWSERGLIGVLLLGEKQGGGLYTQEEIEVARASGERLIDTRASAEMARRLMELQRARLTETRLADRQTRRLLHDDILPQLHLAILSLSWEGAAAETVKQLAEVHSRVSDLLRELPAASGPEVARLGLVGALRQAVCNELAADFDAVHWEAEPELADRADKLSPLVADALYYAAREAIRNSARHGRADPASPLHLWLAARWREGVEIEVRDDGVGLGGGAKSPKMGGHGLALHSTMLAVVGGTLEVESVPGAYTRVVIRLPVPGERNQG
jgi:signal transduction histidine kinase